MKQKDTTICFKTFIQGRWFCPSCRRMYTGTIPADQLEVRHTCGAVMTRTPSLWEGD